MGSFCRAAHLECDRCGDIEKVRYSRGRPPLYIRQGKAKQRWGVKCDRYGDREDYCPACCSILFGAY